MDSAEFRKFVLGLDDRQQRRLASLAGTTISNLRSHWIHARRIPKGRHGINRLHEACLELGAKFSKQQLLAFFYDEVKA
jgi:hypothetical protein